MERNEKPERKPTQQLQRAGGRPRAAHDPEEVLGRGMSSEGVAEDEAETMASTGDSEGSFRDIVTGTATGLGIDRGESIGTGGLAAGEDLDEVAEGDYWRQNFQRRPYYEPGRPYERYEPGYRYGWQSAVGYGPEAVEFEDIETEIARAWSYDLASGEMDWEDVREAVRDAWRRVRGRE